MNYLVHPYEPMEECPRPCLDFILENPTVESLRKPCRGVIDTGSDVTFIPEDHILRLNLGVIGSPKSILGLGGLLENCYPYAASIGFDGNPSEIVEVFSWKYNFALLGRNWLREYCIKLDGPCESFSFLESECTSNMSD